MISGGSSIEISAPAESVYDSVSDDTVRVTESYTVDAPRWILSLDAALGRPRALERGVRETLAALKQAAEHQA